MTISSDKNQKKNARINLPFFHDFFYSKSLFKIALGQNLIAAYFTPNYVLNFAKNIIFLHLEEYKISTNYHYQTLELAH